MSNVIPEIILQKAVVGGIQAIKADPRLINVLFKNMSLEFQEDIKNYITQKTIDWSVNYPKKQSLKVPAIVLIMRSESEAETFLGDMMGYENEQDVMYDTTDGHGGSISDLDGLQEPLVQGLEVTESVGSLVTIAEASLPCYQEVYQDIVKGECFTLHVTSGTGTGQVHTILSATNYSLDTDADFTVNLDSTSVIDIRHVGEILAEGEPSRVYNSNLAHERIGVHYDTQYQLQIIAGQQDEVIYLYSLVKALLLSQRPFLEGQGMMVFKLSGADFAPRGEYLPSEAFMRVMNIQFTYPFSFLRELEVATSIQVCLTPDEAGLAGSGTPISIGPITIE